MDVDFDEDEEESEHDFNSVPMRRARNLTLITSVGKKGKFVDVENGSGHRFNATVSSWYDPDDEVEIQSEEILDADVYDSHGILSVVSSHSLGLFLVNRQAADSVPLQTDEYGSSLSRPGSSLFLRLSSRSP